MIFYIYITNLNRFLTVRKSLGISYRMNEPTDLESYFIGLISENKDIPEQYLERFQVFFDSQARASNEAANQNQINIEESKKFGFDSHAEYQSHLKREYHTMNSSEAAQLMDDFNHTYNVLMTEKVFIEMNSDIVFEEYSGFVDKIVLGKHSHIIMSDFVYSHGRTLPRAIVTDIMSFIAIIDIDHIKNITTDREANPEDSEDSENSD